MAYTQRKAIASLASNIDGVPAVGDRPFAIHHSDHSTQQAPSSQNSSSRNSQIWRPIPNYDEQSASSFFRRLPPELRCEIYLYALSPTYPPSHGHPYPYYVYPLYQPPDTRPHLYFSLLLACRKLYNEAAYIFVSEHEHTLIYAQNRTPFDMIPKIAPPYFRRMVPWQLAAVRKLHVCAEQRFCRVSDELAQMQQPKEPPSTGEWIALSDAMGGPFPREITVTVRHWAWPRTPEPGVWKPEGWKLEPEWFFKEEELEKALSGVEVLRFLMEAKGADVEVVRERMPEIEKHIFEARDGKVLVCRAGAKEWKHRERIAAESDAGGKVEEESTVFEIIWRVCH